MITITRVIDGKTTTEEVETLPDEITRELADLDRVIEDCENKLSSNRTKKNGVTIDRF